jgi:hypothetical protein
MSEETNEQQQAVEAPKELNLQQSFNLLVNLARQSKLTYDEHALVDKAVRDLHEALDLQE